mmetsp:Transcript_53366/g.111380  ORF Transcript_53366/g.111380 Transcript_53366/m.111380 type:complete len:82 (+) Transcript_53366:1940-2185(+)
MHCGWNIFSVSANLTEGSAKWEAGWFIRNPGLCKSYYYSADRSYFTQQLLFQYNYAFGITMIPVAPSPHSTLTFLSIHFSW